MHATRLGTDDVAKLMAELNGVPSLIFDVRGYPDWRVGAELARQLYPATVRAAASEEVDTQQPGRIFTVPDTARPAPRAVTLYRGRVIVLANEFTQSAAEGMVMTLQAYPGALTVGSSTAGANGNTTAVTLPGGIDMYFSGVLIKYPDNTPTQRRGVRIDVPVRPTQSGIAAGRDEVLDKALQLALPPRSAVAGQ